MNVRAVFVCIIAVAILLVFQNCARVSQDGSGQMVTVPVESPANDGFPIEGKTYVLRDPSCSDSNPLRTQVRATSPTSALVLREFCADVVPPRVISAGDFSIPAVNPDTLLYNGQTLVLEATPVVAAPQFVNAQSNIQGNSAAISVGAPSGLAVGDLLVAYVSDYQYLAVTPPAGWSAVTNFNSTDTGYGVFVFSKFATAADVGANYTFNLAGVSFDNFAMIAAYRGTALSSPIELGGWNDANLAQATSTATYLGGTSSQANSMVVAFGASDLGGNQPAAPQGMASQYYTASYATRLSAAIQAQPGATGNFTGGAGSRWITNVLIIKGR